jgi:hypothetical protein
MKSKFRFVVFVSLVLVCFSCYKKNQDIHNYDNVSSTKEGFLNEWKYEILMADGAERNAFRLWIPDGVSPRAILILAPGNASDGTGLVENHQWKEFAIKEKVALLGVHVASDTETAAQNLIRVLGIITKERGVEHIADLPFLLRGHSHGGRFSHLFSSYFPKRTLAYSNIKGTLTEVTSKLPPGLFIVGEHDLASRNKAIEDEFFNQRNLKGIVAYAFEPGGYHGVGDADDLIRPFFSSILKTRLDSNGVIIDLKEEDFLLANNTTFEVLDYNNYSYKKEEATCILDEDFKNAWLDFVN